jgi:hypothetical protein
MDRCETWRGGLRVARPLMVSAGGSENCDRPSRSFLPRDGKESRHSLSAPPREPAGWHQASAATIPPPDSKMPVWCLLWPSVAVPARIEWRGENKQSPKRGAYRDTSARYSVGWHAMTQSDGEPVSDKTTDDYEILIYARSRESHTRESQICHIKV